MTVDLNMMLDMRDAQLAAEVARKAELGWFDVEFTIYGCCYWDKGERFYRLSADAEKIYNFIENGAKNGIMPSNIMAISEKYPVPVGMQDSVTLDVKKALARKMQEAYPAEFFHYLAQLKKKTSQDDGYAFLLEKKKEAESCFENEKLRRFAVLLEHFYACNKVSAEHYALLRQWLNEERKNMEDDPIRKDICEKTFYAVGYLNGEQVKYVSNARKATVYKKRDELLRRGFYTTPVYEQTYYYNYNVRLPQVSQWFENELKEHFTKEHITELQKIIAHNSQMSKDEFALCLQKAEADYGPIAKDTLLQYGYRWGIM